MTNPKWHKLDAAGNSLPSLSYNEAAILLGLQFEMELDGLLEEYPCELADALAEENIDSAMDAMRFAIDYIERSNDDTTVD